MDSSWHIVVPFGVSTKAGEDHIARAMECLARRSGAFRVMPEQIEIELAGGALAVLVRRSAETLDGA
jgi:hypothetical protein